MSHFRDIASLIQTITYLSHLETITHLYNMNKKGCVNCGHPKLIVNRYNPAGDVSCERCGTVQDENPIVSEVQFGESSLGAAMVQGAMVGADQARANYGGGRQNAMESREQTLANGKRKIKRIAAALNIPEYISDSAGEWFKLALAQNFVQGRRSQNVLATCLYVACRKEKTHHMLIDFSSRLQISVYSLGATFLKMVKALHIVNLPLADPSLFIQHFAEKLDFKEKCTKVVRDAVKLAQRMSEDWIHEGRRPAGIAGACVLLAARMNNFRRTHAEIVAVAHVGPETLQRRLNEFKKTKSGELTVNSFRESEKTESSNPPSYEKNRSLEQKIANKILIKEMAVAQFDNWLLKQSQAESSGVRAVLGKSEKPSDNTRSRAKEAAGNQNESEEIESEKDQSEKDQSENPRDSNASSESSTTVREGEPTSILEGVDIDSVPEDEEPKDNKDKDSIRLRKHHLFMDKLLQNILASSDLTALEIHNEVTRVLQRKKKSLEEAMYATPVEKSADTDGGVDPNKPKNLVKYLPKTHELLEKVSSSIELNSDDDDEITLNCELNEEEKQLKERIWTGLNHDFIIQQEKKRLKQEADQLAGNTSGQPRKKRQKQINTNIDQMGVDDALKNIGVNEITGEPLTAAESSRQYWEKKPLSKKLNYQTLDLLFENPK
ncbi:TFIIB-domain-containing protein [Suhomyces tanzawaensis NRRL Y-17324]|uniref:B-related factor 1 n=1 Tax=Suhomyces tanzawaensis NRRL Y-17324 TaxID=984487 RepID=A0A1E4SKX6_9ASCO|nr:TFIIB-domain-containing protein [Suhomyces tanzawaensis NRRL Y-17324]ODV80092.1 TFIIB-domain-containing protein [Suhomyces tanzawaensis NRRL Y-17324]